MHKAKQGLIINILVSDGINYVKGNALSFERSAESA